jgi:hypothetical protein
MMKVILTIKEEDLDFILRSIIGLEVKKIKVKKKIKQKNIKATLYPTTYNEPDE